MDMEVIPGLLAWSFQCRDFEREVPARQERFRSGEGGGLREWPGIIQRPGGGRDDNRHRERQIEEGRGKGKERRCQDRLSSIQHRYYAIPAVLPSHGDSWGIAALCHDGSCTGICNKQLLHAVEVHSARHGQAMRMRVQQRREALQQRQQKEKKEFVPAW